jgi:hypothetical protein
MGTLHDQRPRLEIGLDAGYREIWAWVHKYMGADEPRNVTPEQWQAAAAERFSDTLLATLNSAALAGMPAEGNA